MTHVLRRIRCEAVVFVEINYSFEKGDHDEHNGPTTITTNTSQDSLSRP